WSGLVGRQGSRTDEEAGADRWVSGPAPATGSALADRDRPAGIAGPVEVGHRVAVLGRPLRDGLRRLRAVEVDHELVAVGDGGNGLLGLHQGEWADLSDGLEGVLCHGTLLVGSRILESGVDHGPAGTVADCGCPELSAPERLWGRMNSRAAMPVPSTMNPNASHP